jgi:3-phenylpropionate/trans-cinnamate dioxygenase ferredoxin reductase subunit
VVVGAGQAGGRAALTLREEGFDGPVVLIGAESHAPYERPPLSKAFLTGDRAPEDFTFASAAMLAEAGIEFRAGLAADAIDRSARRVRLSDGSVLAYEKLLLATGRAPRRLPFGDELAGRVHVLRDLADAERLRSALAPGSRLAVVGGGFIGLEVAASATALGVRVTVIEVAPQLLSRAVPASLAAHLLARHVDAGVTMLIGRHLRSLEPMPDGIALLLEDGTPIEADLALVGIGAEPRVALAEQAGLAVDRGIIVDASLATSDPHIFAAGDVCAFPDPEGPGLLRLEAWQNADCQGAQAARNMLGADETYRPLPWFWSDQYELTLQIAGFPDLAARTVERNLGTQGRILFHLGAEGRILGVSGVGTAALGRELRLGQMMVERHLTLDPAVLADPGTRLKTLVR